MKQIEADISKNVNIILMFVLQQISNIQGVSKCFIFFFQEPFVFSIFSFADQGQDLPYLIGNKNDASTWLTYLLYQPLVELFNYNGLEEFIEPQRFNCQPIYIGLCYLATNKSKIFMDPINWKEVAVQAISHIDEQIAKVSHTKTQESLWKLKTSCVETAEAIMAAYQKSSKKQMSVFNFGQRLKPNNILSQLSQEEKKKIQKATLVTYQFSDPSDHWITFIYDTTYKVWVMLQSWESNFTLELWLRYKPLEIAVSLRETMGQQANPLTHLADYSKVYCHLWLVNAINDQQISSLKEHQQSIINGFKSLDSIHWRQQRSIIQVIVI